MKANEAFRKFFTLERFRKITVFLLIFLVCFASYLALAYHEPWRFITTNHPNDLILPKEPQDFPRHLIIEAPELELKNHEEKLHPELPFLYVQLPTDLPKEVIAYLELRNTYIHQLYDRYYSSEAIPTDQPIRGEIIPFIYDGQDCFFALKWNEMTLYDTSFNKIHVIKEEQFSSPIIVSAKFLDRFWTRYYLGGAVLGSIYFLEVTYQNEINTQSMHHGDYGDFDIDPYNTMKIINIDTNPEMKVHISGHRGYLFYPIIYLFVFYPPAYMFLIFLANHIIRYLLIAILALFLAYIGIILAQKNKQKKAIP